MNCRTVKLRTVAFTLAIAVPATTVVAREPAAATTAPSLSAENAESHAEGFPPEFYDAIKRAEGARTPEEVAEALFPQDLVAQAQILPELREIDRIQYGESDGPSTQALPVALVPLVGVVTGCVIGAVGSWGASEIVSQLRHGNRLEAEARVDAAISGCITGAVPAALRPIANAAKVPLRNAVLAVMVRWYQIT